MNRLRTLAFSIVFYGLSTMIVLTAPVSAVFGQRAMIAHASAWAHFHRWCARVLLGIRSRVEGDRPVGPTLYAAKHQSMFETIELTLRLDAPVIVMKQELARIPVFGWAARRYGIIAVDRAGSGTALRAMMREAKVALSAGRSVLIFPEGTRVAPGETPPLKSGFAGLYRMLGLPVVPIALDSGRAWPRRGPKRPGIVTFRLGDAVPPGLPRRDAEAAVHAGINVLD